VDKSKSGFYYDLLAREEELDLAVSRKPEFDSWKWVNYWHPTENVVFFKRRVYQCALAQLESCLPIAAK